MSENVKAGIFCTVCISFILFLGILANHDCKRKTEQKIQENILRTGVNVGTKVQTINAIHGYGPSAKDKGVVTAVLEDGLMVEFANLGEMKVEVGLIEIRKE